MLNENEIRLINNVLKNINITGSNFEKLLILVKEYKETSNHYISLLNQV